MVELKAKNGYLYTDKNKTFFAEVLLLGKYDDKKNYRQIKIEGNEELINKYKNGDTTGII